MTDIHERRPPAEAGGPHLDDDVLADLGRTLARPARVEHLAGCPECRARLTALAATADALLGGGPVPGGVEDRVLDALPVEGRPRRPGIATLLLPVNIALAAGTGFMLTLLGPVDAGLTPRLLAAAVMALAPVAARWLRPGTASLGPWSA